MRKAITASLFTLLCAAAGAVPFASGGPEPAKPAHHHPATHGTPKALAPIIAEARLATSKYATSLEAARKAGYTVNVTRMIPDMGWHFLNPKITGFEAVSVTTQPTFAFGNAVVVPKLFLMAGAGLRTPYDIAPDGRLVGRITAGHMEFVRSAADQIQVVLNWFEELKARVPGTTR